ncbi:MAG: type II toxin-antitoxin system PemK/MazF family toxin [Syntrophales bacterium]
MTRKREHGAVWLTELNPRRGTEPARTTPVLLIQHQALLDAGHPTTLVVPLTTRLIENAAPLRLRVRARERLENDCDLLIDQVRAIDSRHLLEGPLAHLDAGEMAQVYAAILEIMGIQLAPDAGSPKADRAST